MPRRQQRIKVIKVDSDVGENPPIDENNVTDAPAQELENESHDIQPEVQQEVQPEEVKPEVQQEEVQPEEVKPEVQPEEVQPEVKPEETPKTKTRVQELVECDKCGKAMTARTLKYYHPREMS